MIMSTCSQQLGPTPGAGGGSPRRHRRSSSASRALSDMSGTDTQSVLTPSASAPITSDPDQSRQRPRWASSPPLLSSGSKPIGPPLKDCMPVPLPQSNRRSPSRSLPSSRGSRPSSIDTSVARLSTSPSDRSISMLAKRPTHYQPHAVASPHTRGFSAPTSWNSSPAIIVAGRAASCCNTPTRGDAHSPRSPKDLSVNGAELVQVLVQVVQSMSGLGTLASQLSLEHHISDGPDLTMKRATSSPVLPFCRSPSPSVGSHHSSRSSSPVCRRVSSRTDPPEDEKSEQSEQNLSQRTLELDVELKVDQDYLRDVRVADVHDPSDLKVDANGLELHPTADFSESLSITDIPVILDQLRAREEEKVASSEEEMSQTESPTSSLNDSPPLLMSGRSRSPDWLSSPRSILKRSPSVSTASSTTTPRSIHFGVKMEHICIFGFHDQPIDIQHSPRSTLPDVGDLDAASASAMWAALIPPPFEQIVACGTWHILNKNLPPFVTFSQNENVRLESVRLATVTGPHLDLPRPVLVGNAIVRNIDFEKRVFARFSTDEWGSYTETNGTYASSVHGGIDRFTFNLDLAELFAGTEERLMKRKVVKIALRFEAQGREFWDNCCGTNYEVEVTFSPPKGIVLGVKRGVVLPEGFEMPEGTSGPDGIIFEERRSDDPDSPNKSGNFLGPLVIAEIPERALEYEDVDEIPRKFSMSSWGGSTFPPPSMGGGRRAVSLTRNGSSLVSRIEESVVDERSNTESVGSDDTTVASATESIASAEETPLSALDDPETASPPSTPIDAAQPSAQSTSTPPPYFHNHPSWFATEGAPPGYYGGYYGYSGAVAGSHYGCGYGNAAMPMAQWGARPVSPANTRVPQPPSSLDIEVPMSAASSSGYGGYYYGFGTRPMSSWGMSSQSGVGSPHITRSSRSGKVEDRRVFG